MQLEPLICRDSIYLHAKEFFSAGMNRAEICRRKIKVAPVDLDILRDVLDHLFHDAIHQT